MKLARVVGNVWSTKKNDKIHALRLLFVQPLGRGLTEVGDVIVAADEIGAGAGDLILLCEGAPAMQAFDRKEPIPVDAVVIGIVDSLEMPEKVGE
ncbi:MAG: EutN/CcmL family microcompartment protein [Syntrophobacteraceae bacterium]|nr:EutN/CcmL family microcompartment protein [Syntrophobacteraceae bacterium]